MDFAGRGQVSFIGFDDVKVLFGSYPSGMSDILMLFDVIFQS